MASARTTRKPRTIRPASKPSPAGTVGPALPAHEQAMIAAVRFALADDTAAWHRLADAIVWKCLAVAGYEAALRITGKVDPTFPEPIGNIDLDTDIISRWVELGQKGGWQQVPPIPTLTAPALKPEDKVLHAAALIRDAVAVLESLPADFEINCTPGTRVAKVIREAAASDLDFFVGHILAERFHATKTVAA